MNVFTIGVYGSSEEAFFAALLKSGVNTFCDVRWRRGVRGKEYAFVNSKRLQRRLGELGIRYVHLRDLAPPPALRRRQYEADQAKRVGKRQRTGLDDAFVEGYRREVLAGFDSKGFVERLGPDAGNVVLFCVEREPGACHRSVLAQRLEQDLGSTITHIVPEQSA